MGTKNAIYAQSGGVTSVINATACGLIETARKYPNKIGTVFAAKNGIIGALREELIDTGKYSDEMIAKLKHTPSGAFGSCRYKLQSSGKEYDRLIEVFKAHDIGYFFYNGGGDSQDTAHKISQIGQEMGYPITCIGIPKTVDNDLPYTDTCPGFGSVAKYIAISTKEAGFDVASMAESSTKVFILEVMGRHAGWIAAASGLASESADEPPHIILFPEVPFDEALFLEKVTSSVTDHGYCVIVVSEGVKNKEGKFLSDAGLKDAFGHTQLGGVAPTIARLVKETLGYKYHWAVADYLQRAARHIASQTDVDQAYALGSRALEMALEGQNAIMPIIVRDQDEPYQWHIEHVPLEKVANQEKAMAPEFISNDGFSITEPCRTYLKPLIRGEAYPPYLNGMPDYIRLNHHLVEKKLPSDQWD